MAKKKLAAADEKNCPKHNLHRFNDLYIIIIISCKFLLKTDRT